MAIDWSMARQPNVLAMAMEGYEQGKQMRREEKSRNALGTLITNPNDTAAFSTLAQNAPEYALQFREQQQQVQVGQAKQRGDQMQQLGRLLNHATDETTYQQSLAAAKQIGLDVLSAPPSFDPQWVNQQKLVLQAYEKDGGQALSNYAKVGMDMGLQGPELAAFVKRAYEADQVKTIPYTQGGGVAGYNPVTGAINTVVAPNPGGYAAGAPVQPRPAPQPTQQRKPITVQAAMKAVQDVGAGAAQFIRNNGFAVQVTSPQEARQLPSGTPIILPDGSEGVVP